MIIVQNFGHDLIENYNLHPWHTLQTRIVSFPDQEKLLEKVDGVRFKILINAKSLSIKNPQIKHFLCPKNVMTQRIYLCNLQTRKKQLKK